MSKRPYPSWADAGYLSYYPPLYVGLMLLMRARVLRFSVSVWLDGLLGALALASVAASVLAGSRRRGRYPNGENRDN